MGKMVYKSFKDEVKLSRLGMGNMRLPMKTDEPGQPIDYEAAKKIIDRAMEAGVNYYDTAYIYHNGESEVFTGKALKEYSRDSYYVADKFNYQANPDYKAQFAEQLKRLDMEYIDFYLLHSVQDCFADDMIKSGCIAYFDQLKREGKIRFFGFSFHGTPKLLRRMLGLYPFDFVQIQLNYYDWFYGDAKVLYDILDEAEIPVMVMEPVHGGMLADLGEKANVLLREAAPDRSVASWAVRWVMGLPRVQVVLSGMSNVEQLEDNVQTASEVENISEKELQILKRACDIVRAGVSVPCTKCGYCTPNCPVGLDIPMLLSYYNNAKMDGVWRLNNLADAANGKVPSACIGCGACASHCPQSFDIPGYMSELVEMMGKN